jgi:hypothetical protein
MQMQREALWPLLFISLGAMMLVVAILTQA